MYQKYKIQEVRRKEILWVHLEEMLEIKLTEIKAAEEARLEEYDVRQSRQIRV